MVGQCELRKVRIKERAKNGSIRVPGSGDDLTGVMRAGKNENECGRAKEWMKGGEARLGRRGVWWSVSCCGGGDVVDR